MNRLSLPLKWPFASLIVVQAATSWANGPHPLDAAAVSSHTFTAKEIGRSMADARSYGSPVTSVFGEAKGASRSFEATRENGAGAAGFADELGAAERRQRLAEEDRAAQRLRDSRYDGRGRWPSQAVPSGMPSRPDIAIEKPVPGVVCASGTDNSIGCSRGF
ncbi:MULTISPECIES: hypothetical protein [Burkholderia]|uniref:DUF4148 domain-containing protein n=1 Tax=Burkholderia savannae TaxID=1637837 RepID=A0ABR5T5F8_9BURK|nr:MULTISPECIES: hypothetical protein [Burkholderia]KVK81792.1 hypothetical protein WS91_10365 [Burkholderia sp. MSMB1498]KWZ38444.1 hypothetical protein WS72_26780 [Burkholderia savannae]